MSAINFEDLEPEVQAQLAPQIEAAGGTAAAKKAKRSQAARTRLDTGADFEGSVDMLHAQYEFRRWGRMRRNNPQVKWIKGKPRVVGAADVDRSGWLRVHVHWDPKREANIWKGCDGVSANGEIIPTAFDSKVLQMGAATYQHDRELQHQLHSLRDAANAGEYAFLLVLARQVGVVFALPIQKHFDALISGRGVKLFERLREDSPAGGRIATTIPHVAYGPEWSYIPLLQHCAPR